MSEQWTTAQMPDLSEKVAIITGGNSGIGFETARELARRGAITVLACRNPTKAEAARVSLAAELPGAQIPVMSLDLADLGSVREFARAFLARYDRLDLLINNAGIMAVPYGVTADGFESQMGVNHLGHFALTGLLWELLVQTPGARVVNISSNAHHRGEMDFDSLLFPQGRGYSPFQAYARSKLANLLFTQELQHRLQAAGSQVLAVAAHPGGSNTNLAGHFQDRWYVRLLYPLVERMMQSAAMGALPTLRAAVDGRVQGGDYYGPDGFMGLRGHPIKVEPNPRAHRESDARQLWAVSEDLTGVRCG